MRDSLRTAGESAQPGRRSALVVTFAVLWLSSCGDSAPTPSSTAEGVGIHGIVTNLTLAACEDVSASDASSIPVTFSDGQGNVVGTATTGETTLTQSSGYCAATAPYSVDLPREDLYEASFPGKLNPERMSYDDLERANFAWNLGAEIQVNE
jgi:hypothetical protein